MAVPLLREVQVPYARGGGNSRVSSHLPCQILLCRPAPGNHVDTPRHKSKGPCKVPWSTSTSTQSRDLSSDTDVYCFCCRPDDGWSIVHCDQCDGWFHGRCIGVTRVCNSSNSAKRETPGVPGSSLRRLPATPGSRRIQDRVRGITDPPAEALGIPGALYPTALAAPGR